MEIASNSHLKKMMCSLLDSLGFFDVEYLLRQYFPDGEIGSLSDVLNMLGDLEYMPEISMVSKKENISYPSIYIEKETPYTLLKFNEEFAFCYNPVTEKIEEKNLDKAGYVIELNKLNEEETALSKGTKNWFFRILLKFKKLFVQIIFLSSILSFFSLITPLFILAVFSQINSAEVEPDFLLLSSGILLFILSNFVFKIARDYTLNFLGTRLGLLINIEVYKRILRLPGRQTMSQSLSSHISKLRRFSSIRDIISGSFTEKIVDFPFVVIMLGVMYLIGKSTAIVPIIMILLFIIAGIVYAPLAKKINTIYFNNQREESGFLIETVTNLKVLELTNSQNKWLEKFRKIITNRINNTERNEVLNSISKNISSAVISLATLATIYVGVNNVINGSISNASLMACVLILWKILEPLKSILSLSVQMQRLSRTISDLDKFMETELEINSSVNTKTNFLQVFKIEFKDVAARYLNESKFVLRNCTFEVNREEVTLILGKAGAGKSLITKLLFNILPAQVGRILINDLNIQQYDVSELRNSMALAPKELNTFGSSLYDFFRTYNYRLERVTLEKYLKKIGLRDIADNLDMTSEEINSLSLCKKRRLLIIAAFLKDVNLTVIENASKGLSETGLEFASINITEFKKGRTIILLANDERLIDVADRIIVLGNGKITFSGNKEEYLKRKNAYEK